MSYANAETQAIYLDAKGSYAYISHVRQDA